MLTFGIDMVLLAVLSIACITDIRSRRIPNRLLMAGLASGWLILIYQQGALGLLDGFLGLGLGLTLLIIPFALGGIGAGDVKLLALVGALKGPAFVFHSFLAMALAGGMMAAALLMSRRELKPAIGRIGSSLTNWTLAGFSTDSFRSASESWSKQEMSQTLPYGVCIAVGVLVTYAIYH